MDKKRILIVDDEADLCEILSFNIESEGYDVDIANSAEEVLKKDIASFNLILLDVMMNQMSGFELANRLKKDDKYKHIPIIFLTAKETENDILTGFSVGADDYIKKPFSVKEVTARIKVVLNRSSVKNEIVNEIISYETITLNSNQKSVNIDGKMVILTKKEFDILYILLKNPGNIYSRQTILELVWNDESYVLDRTVDVHITRLRKKIGKYGNNIISRTGYGYYFEK